MVQFVLCVKLKSISGIKFTISSPTRQPGDYALAIRNVFNLVYNSRRKGDKVISIQLKEE